jgi:uncharacterized protein (DUF1501 family)
LGEALSRGLEIDRIALRQGMDDGAAKARAGYNTIAGMRQAAQGAASLMAVDERRRHAVWLKDPPRAQFRARVSKERKRILIRFGGFV